MMKRLLSTAALALALSMAFLAAPSPAWAHPRDEVPREFTLRVRGVNVELEVRLRFGEAVGTSQWALSQGNRNKILERLSSEITGKLSLKQNGRAIAMSLRPLDVKVAGSGFEQRVESVGFNLRGRLAADGGRLRLADQVLESARGPSQIHVRTTDWTPDAPAWEGEGLKTTALEFTLRPTPALEGGLDGPPGSKEAAEASARAGTAAVPGTVAGELVRLRGYLTAEKLDPRVILAGLLVALIWGAGHALTPGHGKTVVGAYLIGSKGRVTDAVILGGTVTFTHTASVFLLGLVMWFFQDAFLSQRVQPYMETASGLLILGLGLWMLFFRKEHSHDHGHDHAHDHDHGHGHHHHAPPDKVTWGPLLSLGVSGGMVPCPGALALLLLSFAIHRVAFGLLLLVAFSVGLAGVLIGIGILMVKARPLAERFDTEGRFLRLAPKLSAVAITIIGAGIALAPWVLS